MDLKEAVKKYRSSITALQDRTKRKIPVLRAAVEEVHDVMRDLRERVEVVRDTIHNTIQNHIRELEEQERELIDQLESISNSKEKVSYRRSPQVAVMSSLERTAAWLAQLVECQSAVREVEGSSPGPDQHSGS